MNPPFALKIPIYASESITPHAFGIPVLVQGAPLTI